MTSSQMAPRLSEDDLDDLIYFARAGEKDDLLTHVSALAQREGVSTAEILVSAKDDGKSTCLHMATGNGHLGTYYSGEQHSRGETLATSFVSLESPRFLTSCMEANSPQMLSNCFANNSRPGQKKRSRNF